MTEYVTLESALAALEYMLDDGAASFKALEKAKGMLVKRTFKTVGRASNLVGTSGAWTQAVFEGKDVKENDWVYVEVKQQ